METFRINTTAWEEEAFFITTDLNEKQIIGIITPIVELERSGGQNYGNYDLVDALDKAYPENTIKFYQEIKTIVI